MPCYPLGSAHRRQVHGLPHRLRLLSPDLREGRARRLGKPRSLPRLDACQDLLRAQLAARVRPGAGGQEADPGLREAVEGRQDRDEAAAGGPVPGREHRGEREDRGAGVEGESLRDGARGVRGRGAGEVGLLQGVPEGRGPEAARQLRHPGRAQLEGVLRHREHRADRGHVQGPLRQRLRGARALPPRPRAQVPRLLLQVHGHHLPQLGELLAAGTPAARRPGGRPAALQGTTRPPILPELQGQRLPPADQELPGTPPEDQLPRCQAEVPAEVHQADGDQPRQLSQVALPRLGAQEGSG